jgi:hypothetical protein
MEDVCFEEASFWIDVTAFGAVVEVDLTLDLAVVVSSSQNSSSEVVLEAFGAIVVDDFRAMGLEETFDEVELVKVMISSQKSSSVAVVDLRTILLVNVLFGTEELVLLIVDVL